MALNRIVNKVVLATIQTTTQSFILEAATKCGVGGEYQCWT